LFGTGSIDEDSLDHLTGNRIRHDGRAGAGAGLNFFFTRYLGISGEAYSENANDDPFVDDAGGNAVIRFPIGNSFFSPYIFGGGGHQFNPVSQTYEDGGLGFEFRFIRHLSLFIDGRYVFAERTENYGLGRAGLRFSF
jgi:hypothetical protein